MACQRRHCHFQWLLKETGIKDIDNPFLNATDVFLLVYLVCIQLISIQCKNQPITLAECDIYIPFYLKAFNLVR